jgi:membrane protease YdiL (CAAX protease family)
MKIIASIFWNFDERRIRALWRLVIQTMMVLPIGYLMKYLFLLVAGLIALATQTITLAQFDYETIKELFKSFSATIYDFPMIAAWFLTILLTVWLAGRFLDRRCFANFGFHFSKNWWIDFGFGLFLGAFLITIVFLIQFIAGWVTITGTFVTKKLDDPFALAILYPFVILMMVAIQEELTSRGYQLTNLAEGLNGKRLSPHWAIVIASFLSAILFALEHADNAHASALSTFSAFLGGLILALGYILTGNLAIPIGFHFTWNLFQSNVFGSPVSGYTFDSATVIAIERNGPELWIGDAFGPEAGLLTLGAVVLGCLLIVLWVRLRYGRVQLFTTIAEAPERPTTKNEIASVAFTHK